MQRDPMTGRNPQQNIGGVRASQQAPKIQDQYAAYILEHSFSRRKLGQTVQLCHYDISYIQSLSSGFRDLIRTSHFQQLPIGNIQILKHNRWKRWVSEPIWPAVLGSSKQTPEKFDVAFTFINCGLNPVYVQYSSIGQQRY